MANTQTKQIVTVEADNLESKQTANSDNNPTIAAIATPVGRGGVGVIRISGSRAAEIAMQLTTKTANDSSTAHSKPFEPRHATLSRFYAGDGTVIDEGIVLYFKSPHSFTGEDVIELQGHGGVVLQNQLLARVFELGARQAVAGEFSWRAFDNDKLDLLQAEAIADAIDATSIAAANSAMRSLTGEFSARINKVLEGLVRLRLHVEAAIDFPDEEDVDFLSDGVVEAKLQAVRQQIGTVLATAQQGQLLRDGIHVVLAGRPNAGKSSLLNRLAGQERAIVTEVAGTTRDTLQETIVLNGLSLHLTDTAGLRESQDSVERIGIERARRVIEQADILLLVYDLSTDNQPLVLAEQLFVQLPAPDRLLLIANKRDLLQNRVEQSNQTSVEQDLAVEPMPMPIAMPMPMPDIQTLISDDGKCYTQVNVSCETSQGIDALITALCDKVGFHPPENSLIARTRHIDALQRTQQHLAEAHEQLTLYQAGELVAESLRLAQNSLGEITGSFSADDLLGEIFSSFCIGK